MRILINYVFRGFHFSFRLAFVSFLRNSASVYLINYSPPVDMVGVVAVIFSFFYYYLQQLSNLLCVVQDTPMLSLGPTTAGKNGTPRQRV